MQSKNLLINFLFLCLIASCATKEEIKRRESIDRLTSDMSGQQRVTKSLLLKLQNIENNLGMVSGQIEETQHSQEVTEQNTIDDLKKRVDSIETENKKFITDTNAEISKIYTELKEQKEFLNKVLSEVKSLAKEENQTPSLFKLSIKNYQRKNYKEAKNQFLEIVNDLKPHRLNQRDQALIFHNLAMTFFIENDFKNSQIYFSKLFTNYEKSPLNSSGLYHLGLTFKKQNKTKEAKEMWTVLMSKYPKSRFTKMAQKEIQQK